jgi:hypothetical protein
VNFLQRAGGAGAGGAANAPDPAMLAIFGGVMCVIFIIALTIQIFFLLNISKTLTLVSPRNRKMEPGMVWLNLIPCLQMVWTFLIVLRTAESLDDEFYDRRLRSGGDYGKGVGLGWAICAVLSAIPYIGAIFSIPALICFILYWVKIHGYRKQLEGYSKYGDDDDDEDYEDRRDRRDRRRDRDDDDDDDDEDDSPRRRR